MAARHISPLLNWIGEPMSTIVINSYRQAAANWYDGAYAAWQAKGATSLAASYLDLTGNGRNLSVGVAPTWDAVNGWTFNGSTQYLTSVPSGNNYSLIVRFSGAVPNLSGHGIAGVNSTTSKLYLWHRGGGFLNYPQYAYGNTVVNGTQLSAYNAGVLAITKAAGYREGVIDAIVNGTYSGTNYNIYIGALNNAGVAAFFWAGNIQAVGIWNTTLDAATVADISAQMAAL